MEMPILQPLPIPTKGEGFLKRIWVWFVYSRKWRVVEDYEFKVSGDKFIIPKGFVFDGASIPRIFWFVLSPTGLLLIPGLFHDYGYRYDYLLDTNHEKCFERSGKRFWDKLFFKLGEEVNGVHIVNMIALAALWVVVAAAAEHDDVFLQQTLAA